MPSADKPTSDPLGASTDFSKLHTIAELRSDRTDDARLWAPRDALIEVLRLIDSGEIDPDCLLIRWAGWTKDDDHRREYGGRNAGLDELAIGGLLAKGLGTYDWEK